MVPTQNSFEFQTMHFKARYLHQNRIEKSVIQNNSFNNYIFLIQKYQFNWKLDSVLVEDRQEKWEFIYLSKFKFASKFIFQNEQLNQLCGGVILADQMEIVEVFNRAMRISLVRKTNDRLFLNVLFTKKISVQQFFRDQRSLQRRVMIICLYYTLQ